MKIAFQGCFHDPSQPYSSVWECESAYLKALSEVDMQTEYLLFNYAVRNPSGLAKNLANPRAPNFHLYVPRLSRRLIALAEDGLGWDPRGAFLRRQGVDLLHVYEQIHPIPLRFPTVVTYLDLLAEQRPEWSSPEIIQSLRINAHRALHCIAVSESTKKNLMHFYHLPEDRITVIPFGIDHGVFRPMTPEQTEPVRRKFGLPKRYLMCIGPFSPRKNLEYALRAYPYLKEKHSDIGLVMTGSKSIGRDRLAARIRQENLSDVLFVGEVGREELAALYNMASALVYPSPYIGLPILEAMASGCPVAAVDNEAIPDMAGPAAALFSPERVEDLVEKVNQLLQNDDFRASLVQKGKIQAARFVWQETAQKTLDLYRKLVDQLEK